jgi:hypothetical protein
VPDRSIFRQQFLAGIEGEADTNRDAYVTAIELGEFLKEKVINYSRGAQHPKAGDPARPVAGSGGLRVSVDCNGPGGQPDAGTD